MWRTGFERGRSRRHANQIENPIQSISRILSQNLRVADKRNIKHNSPVEHPFDRKLLTKQTRRTTVGESGTSLCALGSMFQGRERERERIKKIENKRGRE